MGFDPNEARDEHGMWTAGAGSAAHAAAKTTGDRTSDKVVRGRNARLPKPAINIARKGVTPSNFWSYQAAGPTPGPPPGIAQADWETLSPGMRREIARQAAKAAAR